MAAMQTQHDDEHDAGNMAMMPHRCDDGHRQLFLRLRARQDPFPLTSSRHAPKRHLTHDSRHCVRHADVVVLPVMFGMRGLY